MDNAGDNDRSAPGRLEGAVRAAFRRETVPYWGVLGLALAVRFVHHSFMTANDPLYGVLWSGGDNHTFDRWAREIAQALWLGFNKLPFFQGPLYPYFLGGVYLRFGHSYDAAVLVQHGLGACTALIVMAIASRVFDRKTGVVAGIGAALCPLYLLYEGEILSDALVLFVNMLAILALLHAGKTGARRNWIIAGALFGLTALARPNTLFVIPFVFVWSIVRTKRSGFSFRRLAWFPVAAAVAIAPATAANWFVGGEFVLISSNGPMNFFVGNEPNATGVFARSPAYYALERGEEQPVRWLHHLGAALRENPASLPKNLARKFWLYVQGGEIPSNVSFYLKREFSPFLQLPITWLWVAPMAMVGLWFAAQNPAFRRFDSDAMLLVVYSLSYSASIVVVFVLSRFRLPVLAVLIMFASYAVVMLAGEVLRWRRASLAEAQRVPRRILAVTCIAALTVIALWPYDPSYLVRWNDHANLARAYEDKKDEKAALRHYDLALALRPDIRPVAESRELLAATDQKTVYSRLIP